MAQKLSKRVKEHHREDTSLEEFLQQCGTEGGRAD